jgi:hypothetical protein
VGKRTTSRPKTARSGCSPWCAIRGASSTTSASGVPPAITAPASPSWNRPHNNAEGPSRRGSAQSVMRCRRMFTGEVELVAEAGSQLKGGQCAWIDGAYSSRQHCGDVRSLAAMLCFVVRESASCLCACTTRILGYRPSRDEIFASFGAEIVGCNKECGRGGSKCFDQSHPLQANGRRCRVLHAWPTSAVSPVFSSRGIASSSLHAGALLLSTR